MRSILPILLVVIVSATTPLDVAHASTRSDFRDAQIVDTIDAYRSFLAEHPKGR